MKLQWIQYEWGHCVEEKNWIFWVRESEWTSENEMRQTNIWLTVFSSWN